MRKVKEQIIPFAMRFQEKIPAQEIYEVKGRYNRKTQTWVWPKRLDNSGMAATFPQTDKPPTTCTVLTRISPTAVKTDIGVDD